MERLTTDDFIFCPGYDLIHQEHRLAMRDELFDFVGIHALIRRYVAGIRQAGEFAAFGKSEIWGLRCGI